MKLTRIFILSGILVLLMFIFVQDISAATTQTSFGNQLCVRHGAVKDCEWTLNVWPFQAWQAYVLSNNYRGFGSAGSLRVDLCITNSSMWTGSCWLLKQIRTGDTEGRTYVMVNETRNIDSDGINYSSPFAYGILHVRVDDAEVWNNMTLYGRKASIEPFSASPSTVLVGNTITVNWNVDDGNPRDATLFWGGVNFQGLSSPDSGFVLMDGSQSFVPQSAGTASFTLRAGGPSATGYTYAEQTSTTQVNPSPPPPPPPSSPTVDLKANNSDGPISIGYNTSAALSWTSSSATSCTASNGWSGGKPLSGSESTGNLTTNKTYTLTCSNSSGSVPDSVTVNVGASPPPPSGCQGNCSQYISQSVSSCMVPGSSNSASITMNNSGTFTWTSGNGHKLGSQNPQDNQTWGFGRVGLPQSVSPGQSAVFNFNVTAPSSPNTYNFQWRMLQEGVQWFGDQTLNVSVNVSSSCAPATPTPTPTPTPSSSLHTVQGYVYQDLNTSTCCSGRKDPGEPGISGRTVTLKNNSTNETRTTTTDASGFYQFTGIPNGSYRLSHPIPSGYARTTDDSLSFSLP